MSKVRGTKKTEPEMDPEELEESIVKYFKIIGKDKMNSFMDLAFNKKDFKN